jgi:hypothetical protein
VKILADNELGEGEASPNLICMIEREKILGTGEKVYL